MRFRLVLILTFLIGACSYAQPDNHKTGYSAEYLKARKHWVDSVYQHLNEDERIGQLFMVAAYSGGKNRNDEKIENLIQKHQIGGLIFMQGGPVRQAMLTNRFQAMAQVPLLIGMDAEWGLGMRLDSVTNLPKQMTLGATRDTGAAYAMGLLAAYQCRRMGVHVNFAPVVDVNNNPANPVINARSFGEDKERVAEMGMAYMRGMQDRGIIACAKHFPGHGDVTVDSHKDLPLITKSKAELEHLELYPFRKMIAAGVKSIMVAHLEVPALEPAARTPTTLSRKVVTELLRRQMGFQGLIFTDALDMKGVAKYYAPGEVDLRAFLAGNDVLLFSQDVPTAIAKIKAALHSGRATQQDLAERVGKILAAKYDAGLAQFKPIPVENITEQLNQFTPLLNRKVAALALTLVRDKEHLTPLQKNQRVLFIDLNGVERPASETAELKSAVASLQYLYVPEDGSTAEAARLMTQKGWDRIVVVARGLSFYPGKSYGLSDEVLQFLAKASQKPNVVAAVMGNAYALKYVCVAGTLVCGFEDNEWTNAAFVNWLVGKEKAPGHLPVTPPCLQ